MNTRTGLFLWLLNSLAAQDPSNCDYYQNVQANRTYYVYSPGYPNLYTGERTCRWTADCPKGYNCRLDCPEINLPQSPSCSMDRLLISRTGDPQLAGAETYCGKGSLTIASTGQRISMGLITKPNTSGGRFSCQLTAQPTTPSTQCRCGTRRQNRIVGGEETGVNEYSMMAGLADVRIAQIKCGAVIISRKHVLTAAHCVLSIPLESAAVIVGEHDVTTGDSPATKGYRVRSFTIHPQFTESNYDYDIAIVTVNGTIDFNDRVGPACLPFKFANNSFAGSKVTLLGWGTTSTGGPTSNVLRKVDVDVISQNSCRSLVSSLTDRQMCTLTPGKDACQDDSGGPALYTDPATGLLFNIGIVSYGRFCAAPDSPGINTRITSFLNWIVTNAPSNYCVK